MLHCIWLLLAALTAAATRFEAVYVFGAIPE
jgi:hypothetical protein